MRKPLKLLLVDFKDSFTYNLYHIFESLDVHVDVLEDGALFTEEQILSYDGIVLSPGPGLPAEKKSMFSVIALAEGKRPLLGVCLGMQGIACHFNLPLYNLNQVQHGVSAEVHVQESSALFNGLPAKFDAGLYHSWAVNVEDQEHLQCTATSKNGVAMAIENSTLGIYGIQFHPESVLTPYGSQLLRNFIKICAEKKK
jgi:anthranilate synthase component 2